MMKLKIVIGITGASGAIYANDLSTKPEKLDGHVEQLAAEFYRSDTSVVEA